MKIHISISIAFFCLPFISFANKPTTIWANAWGGADSESFTIQSLDKEGNIFVAGNTRGTFKLGETTIVNSKSTHSTSYIAKYSPGGSLLWVRGGEAGNTYTTQAITNDLEGNTYISGIFVSPSLQLGSFTLSYSKPYENGKAFIAKYSPKGDVVWAIASDVDRGSWGLKLAFDKVGYLYMSGMFWDDKLIVDGISITNLNPTQSCQFLFKFDLNGHAIWGKSFGSKNDANTALTVDKDGNIILGGSFRSSTINFDNISLQKSDNSIDNIYLAKLSTNSQVLWAKSFGSNGSNACSSIATDLDGNIYCGGAFTGTTLTAGAGISIINNNNKKNKSFLLKYNPEGTAQWIKSSDNGGWSAFSTICTDKEKNVFASGTFDGNISFDNISLTNEKSKGIDMVLLKYKSDGTIVWAKNYGADDNATPNTCLIDKKGDIYITGEFASKEIDFDNYRVYNYSYNPEVAIPYPTTDAFLVKLSQPTDSITVKYCSTNKTAILSIADSAKIYNWMNSSDQSIGNNKSKLTISNPVVGDTYSCQITYLNGFSKTLYAKIYEYKLIADFSLITDCKTNSIQFSDSVISSHFPTEIIWDFGDGNMSTESNPSNKFNKGGKYKVRLEVTNPLSACAEIIEKEVEFVKLNGFTVSKKQIDSRNNQIEVNAEYNPKLQYIYDMGDGTIKHGANNLHTYLIDNATPEYIIKLTTINEMTGCKDEYSESIDVVPFIPNVFTPNADGINDIFAANLDLLIIDRNGIKIYQGKNGWDGNYNGTKAPSDTYFYSVKYSDKNENIQTKKGVVSLIR